MIENSQQKLSLVVQDKSHITRGSTSSPNDEAQGLNNMQPESCTSFFLGGQTGNEAAIDSSSKVVSDVGQRVNQAPIFEKRRLDDVSLLHDLEIEEMEVVDTNKTTEFYHEQAKKQGDASLNLSGVEQKRKSSVAIPQMNETQVQKRMSHQQILI
ncbi:hypothetical protein GOP47_0003493 [Adiantum capillus-veneris]|uniref:Uncharacterized protein n=1 Tax=Adiantum capillus-veneris TaxID=13818 RepID=A0A9D4VCY0_ADICA|nr:hypothetical protein GOP47_0003493 [Adiantum capillus-veneris]